MAQAAPQPPAIKHLMKLPEFFEDEDWLTLSKKIITTANANNILTNDEKFLSIYTALPKNLQKEQKNLLESNSQTTYNDLCTALESRLKVSIHAKLAAQKFERSMGDRKPSVFLRELTNYYNSVGLDNEDIIRTWFAEELPADLANFVYASSTADLTTLANRLDDIWIKNYHKQENKNPIFTSNVEKDNKLEKELEIAKKNIEELTIKLNNMDAGSSTNHSKNSNHKVQFQKLSNNHEYYGNSGEQGSRNWRENACPPLPNQTNTYGLCFYHGRFGNNSRRCNPGCVWDRFQIPRHNCDKRSCKWNNYYNRKFFPKNL